MLEITRLVVRYGSFLALDEIDLNVEEGELVGLIGANGAGKSSLLRAIAGLVHPISGRMTFAGMPLDLQLPHVRAQLGISLVPEGRGLFPRMSVEENLKMGGYSLGDRARLNAKMAWCYELFPVLRERRYQLAGTLSGGQQQMLALCMGLMCEPRILLLDEPSLGLAPIVIQQICDCLKILKQGGSTTLLLAEQNAKMTGIVADRIYVMQTGRIRYHDKPSTLFKNPEVTETFLSI